MKRPILTSLAVTAALAVLSPHCANAQVAANLDNLPQGQSTPPPTAHAPHTPVHHVNAAAASGSQGAHSAPPSQHTSQTRSALPSVPTAPPPPVILPPPFGDVPLHPPVAADPVIAVPKASSSAAPLSDGTLRVLFGTNSADLNADTIAAITNLAEHLKTAPDKRVILMSYATLPGDDISMPRRIALARALAVRSLLVSHGVATTRIYPRALGRPAQTDTAPADRLDILTEPHSTPDQNASESRTPTP
ncbi:OmpA family protein [Neokomagataea thailandica]|uniref:OmpA family protein n=1 Tax=Neokomagataea TaxID=1223423 RepID=UPI000836D185|nr:MULTISPECIES: OmpA family protein [Neokomagataea]